MAGSCGGPARGGRGGRPADGGAFADGVEPWLARLTSLRNVVRQELVRRRLAGLDLPERATVLDVGAGQGTQAIVLARRGLRVVALEPNPAMRAACATTIADQPVEVAARVQVVAGAVEDLGPQARAGAPADPTRRRYDLVMCHGVLMYLDDPREAMARLATRVAPGGWLSILARNADAVPVRPMLHGDWAGALAGLDERDRAVSTEGRARYRNQLGIDGRADHVTTVIDWIDAAGDWTHEWTGVRLASDAIAVDRQVSDDPDELAMLVDLEQRLGRVDPYRRLASLFHLVSARS